MRGSPDDFDSFSCSSAVDVGPRLSRPRVFVLVRVTAKASPHGGLPHIRNPFCEQFFANAPFLPRETEVSKWLRAAPFHRFRFSVLELVQLKVQVQTPHSFAGQVARAQSQSVKSEHKTRNPARQQPKTPNRKPWKTHASVVKMKPSAPPRTPDNPQLQVPRCKLYILKAPTPHAKRYRPQLQITTLIRLEIS